MPNSIFLKKLRNLITIAKPVEKQKKTYTKNVCINGYGAMFRYNPPKGPSRK